MGDDMHAQLDNSCFHGGAFFEAVGDDFSDLARRTQVINADVLDAWFPPAPRVLDVLHEHADWIARTSPPTTAAGLRAAIARTRGIPEANVLTGGGSSDLIFLALREWITPRSRVLLLDPCYGEYAFVLEQVIGCTVDRVPLTEANDWRPDIEQLRARLALGYDLFVLVNPNNPTGRLVSRADLERLVQGLDQNTRVWIDEAYIEYVDAEQTMEPVAARSTHVFVCKSMSKVYALSGMRVAYLCGPAEEMARLRRLTPPWAVSLPAQIAGVYALQEREYYRKRYRETNRYREELRELLALLPGVRMVTGNANFLLCHLDESAPTVPAILEGCQREGVFLRNVGSMGRALGPRVFRTAVKDPATNARIVATVARSLLSARLCKPTFTARSPALR
jgi:histidinol-phosphate/aromatic aminotransferase/cobyric acid decarboxylase-like protein